MAFNVHSITPSAITSIDLSFPNAPFSSLATSASPLTYKSRNPASSLLEKPLYPAKLSGEYSRRPGDVSEAWE
ncbi:hypothetical protein LZ554_004362 [Drepanopeziza brunnea f. sp. 'monogermtubi']|nr:hypothetical protein LZ554_004362 [Drepanopeziza brunnea f. sp. 'monogermtubi']